MTTLKTPNAAQRRALATAYAIVENAATQHSMGAEYALRRHAESEKREKYADARTPTWLVQALLCEWFWQGYTRPDTLLRDVWDCRPAAIYAMGLGASCASNNPLDAVQQRALIYAADLARTAS